MIAALPLRHAPLAGRAAAVSTAASRPALAAQLSRPAMSFRPRRKSVTAPAAAAAAGEPATPAAAAAADVKGDMLEPSTANKPLVRLAALAGVVLVAAKSTSFLPAAALGFVHMLTFGTWFGTLAWTSFVFGIVAFRNLPRQTFGKLQSHLFPKYFAISSAAPAILLATLHYATAGAPPVKEVWLLAIAAVGSLLNLFVAEPAATGFMFERYALENVTGPRDEGEMRG